MTKAKWLGTLSIILFAVLLALIWKTFDDEPVHEAVPSATMPPIDTIHVITLEEAEGAWSKTEAPVTTPVPDSVEEDDDVILLAKIMQEEDGHEWPDAMIMCIGEVVLNRVMSPEFPDTIHDVLYQVDSGYIQYAPVHHSGWDSIEPEARYIELAERLLAGERVLNNPQIVYQALFEQGRGTVVTYHDFYLGSTTYFCLTDSPGLYA